MHFYRKIKRKRFCTEFLLAFQMKISNGLTGKSTKNDNFGLIGNQPQYK